MDRFTVEKRGEYFWVKDQRYMTFGLPERAVAINFTHTKRAETVCNLLNAEWKEFEQNPT